jgi:hypothetical protein
MAQGWVQTMWRGGVWVNVVDDEGESSRHRTKDEAVAVGSDLAQALRTGHVVHNMDGSVRSRTEPGPDFGAPQSNV